MGLSPAGLWLRLRLRLCPVCLWTAARAPRAGRPSQRGIVPLCGRLLLLVVVLVVVLALVCVVVSRMSFRGAAPPLPSPPR
jgi:hypothetical protein